MNKEEVIEQLISLKENAKVNIDTDEIFKLDYEAIKITLNYIKELEIYKNKIAEIKKWCEAVKNSKYQSRFFVDGKEIITDTSYCFDLAKPILEIINRKEDE